MLLDFVMYISVYSFTLHLSLRLILLDELVGTHHWYTGMVPVETVQQLGRWK